PYLALFDGADTNQSTARRDSSTTPLQALFFLNDPQVRRLASSYAARLRRESADDGERVERAFLLAFARPPEEAERAAAREFLARARERLTGAADAEARAWRSFVRGLLLSNELV